MKYTACIIGLGQIGSRFDEDPKRTDIWSHAKAYQESGKVELLAGADISEENRLRFQASRNVHHVYADYREMLEVHHPDIVSICTPTETHHRIALDVAEYPVKAVFLEKPIAYSDEEAVEIVSTYREKHIALAINHLRRWDSLATAAKRIIDEGHIGEIRSLNCSYSAKIYNIGTHLIDTVRYLCGEIEKVFAWQRPPATGEEHDPTPDMLLDFQSGFRGSMLSLGLEREKLIFEIDILGSNGRLRLLENCKALRFYRFAESPNYSSYMEYLEYPPPVQWSSGDPFLGAVNDIVDCIQTGNKPRCDGVDGMKAVAVANASLLSAKTGVPVTLRTSV